MDRRPKPPQKQAYTVETPGTLLPFLLEAVRGKSRNNVKNLLSRGQVAVDGKGVTQFDHPLLPGQEVTVCTMARTQMKLPFPLIYEDETMLVVNKPAGLLTIATDTEKEHTAYHILTDYVRSQDPAFRVFIVHRLDRDTSGVLLLARDEATKRVLQENWEQIVRRRGYQAVTEGVPQPREGTVRSQLKETTAHRVYSVDYGGKEAVTHYKVVQDNKKYALLDVEIDTGRKNQIRVHMADLGHPVAGDKKYNAATNPLGRMGLHACELTFVHPVTKQEHSFKASMPKEFRRLTGSADGEGRKK